MGSRGQGTSGRVQAQPQRDKEYGEGKGHVVGVTGQEGRHRYRLRGKKW